MAMGRGVRVFHTPGLKKYSILQNCSVFTFLSKFGFFHFQLKVKGKENWCFYSKFYYKIDKQAIFS